MWHVVESWQLKQLQRFADHDPERIESVLNTLWTQFPGLFEEMALAAANQDEITVSKCAALLGIAEEDVERRLHGLRQRELRAHCAVVCDEVGNVARIAEGHVAVWEVVREYRKLGSVERLAEAFPALSTIELAAALRYAESHPAEIEGQIARYEDNLQRRRAEYPFAR